MTEIYLIRHTQAEGNRYRMMQGFWDGEVTEMGRRQIEALAGRFADLPLDAVYSSDLHRAVETAEAAARRDRLPIRTRVALRELNIGPWEQKFFGNVCHAQPELSHTFMFDAENFYLEGAETYGDVRNRAMRELRELAEENEGKRIAVVSHGVTIRCILSAVTGVPLNDVKTLPICRNTAVSKLIWDGGRFTAEYVNDISHLPPELQGNWSRAGDVRDELFRPADDRAYYEACYADAWRSAHGNLRHFSADTYYQAALRHHAAVPGSVLRLYEEDEPIGLVDLDPERGASEGVGWISLLYLKEECRGRGYGIQVLARPVFFYRELGRRLLRLDVAEDNAIACRFYRREGFRVVGEHPGMEGKLLLMERPLWDRKP
ncbi:MAG: GNAT family N-acetyltransferase [Oscillospiraceae bacterium]|nr:GNAT family N-acetyltransferase [Oscillospiraceae bacterium]